MESGPTLGFFNDAKGREVADKVLMLAVFLTANGAIIAWPNFRVRAQVFSGRIISLDLVDLVGVKNMACLCLGNLLSGRNSAFSHPERAKKIKDTVPVKTFERSRGFERKVCT